ncbi:MAG: FkbM family methyltransferase [Planktothrix sp.]|uniref:FkbM family methyltransferase n=1 Tax=Planktothrix sp. TaxID=3088171 RepID=UPI0038D465EF
MINNVIQLINIDIFKILELRQKIFGDLNLCVDAGAAAGTYSKKMCNINPQAKVYAYEPFPGNWVHLENTLKEYQTVKIIKKALSDKKETRRLYVSSVVSEGNQSFAKDMIGYSSVGTFWGNADRSKTVIDVECTTLDEEIQDGKINFLKMDVQGAEPLVLNGSKQALERGIEMMFIEFSFQPHLLQILQKYQYVCFDTGYVFSSSSTTTELLDVGFRDLKNATLSTGDTVFTAKFHGDYAQLQSPEFKKTLKIGWLQTDLICVSLDYLKKFFYIIATELGSKI